MQPVIIEDNISIAATSVNPNVIASNTSLRRYLRAPFRCVGKLIMVQSATGLLVDLDYGSKNVAVGCEPRIATTMSEPDDTVNEQWFPSEGDQLILRVANLSGGAVSLRYRIVLMPWDGEFPPDCRVMQIGPRAIAAAAVDIQLLDGLRYERPPVDSRLEVFMTASASGLLRQLNVDTDSIAPPSAINPSNVVPRDPFDATIQGVEVPQDKLVELSVSNPTGGSINVFWKTKFYELARS